MEDAGRLPVLFLLFVYLYKHLVRSPFYLALTLQDRQSAPIHSLWND